MGKGVRVVMGVSFLLNLMLSFLLGRWFLTNVQAYLRMNDLMVDMNNGKALILQGGGRLVHAFSIGKNESDVAVVMKTAGHSLLLTNTSSKRGSEQILRSGMLEIRWVVDVDGFHEVKILHLGKSVFDGDTCKKSYDFDRDERCLSH